MIWYIASRDSVGFFRIVFASLMPRLPRPGSLIGAGFGPSRCFRPSTPGGGDRQHVVAQDVVDVGADRRQHVDAGDVAAGAQEPRVHRMIDDQRRTPAQRLQLLRQFAGLGRAAGGVEHHQLALRLLLRQRRDQPKPPHLLVQAVFVRVRHRTMHHAAAAELRRAQAALPRIAGALLAVRLLRGARTPRSGPWCCACRRGASPTASAPRAP